MEREREAMGSISTLGYQFVSFSLFMQNFPFNHFIVSNYNSEK